LSGSAVAISVTPSCEETLTGGHVFSCEAVVTIPDTETIATVRTAHQLAAQANAASSDKALRLPDDAGRARRGPEVEEAISIKKLHPESILIENVTLDAFVQSVVAGGCGGEACYGLSARVPIMGVAGVKARGLVLRSDILVSFNVNCENVSLAAVANDTVTAIVNGGWATINDIVSWVAVCGSVDVTITLRNVTAAKAVKTAILAGNVNVTIGSTNVIGTLATTTTATTTTMANVLLAEPSTSNTGAIVGGIVGGVAFMGGWVTYFVWRKNNGNQQPYSSLPSMNF